MDRETQKVKSDNGSMIVFRAIGSLLQMKSYVRALILKKLKSKHRPSLSEAGERNMA